MLFTYCKILILVYDDRKVRSFRGTGCQEKVKIIIAPTYDDSRAKNALWNDLLEDRDRERDIERDGDNKSQRQNSEAQTDIIREREKER